MPVPAAPAADYLNGDRTAPLMSQHWTDAKHGTKRRRRIRNWANHWTPGRKWQSSAPRLSIRTAKPPDWGNGAWDFSLAALDCPLQTFANDEGMIGVRRSDRPGSWLNMRPVNSEPTEGVLDADGRTVYAGLWPGCDLICEAGGKETIRIWDKSQAPKYFEWTLKPSPGHTIHVSGDVLRLFDENGDEVITGRSPWGQDSATTAPTSDGRQWIPCTLTEQSSRGGLPVVRLTTDPAAMASAVGVVTIDPTVVISGPVDCEDAHLVLDNPDQNFGGFIGVISQRLNGTLKFNAIFRIKNSALPLGVFTDFNVNYPVGSLFFVSSSSSAMDYRKVLLANVGWSEGSGNGSTGDDATWNQANATTSLAWAGGANGCSVAGTDHETAAAATQLFTLLTIPYAVALPTSWLDDWLADGESGYVVTPVAGGGNIQVGMNSTERVTFYNYDITFTPPITTRPFFFDLLNRKRR